MLLSGSLSAALTSSLWGFFADSFSRIRLMAIGCMLWGLFSVLSAASLNFFQLCLTRTLTGVALASMLPITQGLVADLVKPESRGRVYGLTGFFASAGSATSVAVATTTAEQTVFGLDGWRLQLLVIGAASWVFCAVLLLLALGFVVNLHWARIIIRKLGNEVSTRVLTARLLCEASLMSFG